jgi:hypothetical protein
MRRNWKLMLVILGRLRGEETEVARQEPLRFMQQETATPSSVHQCCWICRYDSELKRRDDECEIEYPHRDYETCNYLRPGIQS